MKVDKLTLERIFERDERLEAPLFQRPYVWKQEENWMPLWESTCTVAEKRLSGLPTRPHFLGTIVLDQVKTPLGRLHARQIIDGQQRLTTLQLALAAARDLCGKFSEHRYAKAFEKLVVNDVPLSDDPNDTFKVWPTNADREDFRRVMKAGSPSIVRKMNNSHLQDERLIPNAYLYFADTVDEWLGPAGTDDFLKRLDALYIALRDDLHLVVIDLEAQDDAQEIFETLNALGTPLLPADLVKNYLFRSAEAQAEDTKSLYERFWAPFDTEQGYWRKQVRQGRLKRPRLDLFLSHYLTLMLGQEVLIAQLFSDYRSFVENTHGRTAANHLELFRDYANVYKGFDDFEDSSREGIFFYRLNELDTTTVYPLLLEVVKRSNATDKDDELHQILGDLESFLVRRTVCELTPKNYNKLFVELVRQLGKNDDFSAGAIRSFLLSQEAETSRWPTDEELEKAWLALQFYKRIKKSKLRMILEALEAALYTGKTEKVVIERRLTIEHLLPREWDRHWPLSLSGGTGDADRQAEKRKEMLHRIGNLTLLTKHLNPAVSNGPWEKKRQEILKHSGLNLNRTLPETWDEKAIDARSEELAKIAIKVWPHP
jgi:uncharacterized protein with ParB-like and HNH nuclease domain